MRWLFSRPAAQPSSWALPSTLILYGAPVSQVPHHILFWFRQGFLNIRITEMLGLIILCSDLYTVSYLAASLAATH